MGDANDHSGQGGEKKENKKRAPRSASVHDRIIRQVVDLTVRVVQCRLCWHQVMRRFRGISSAAPDNDRRPSRRPMTPWYGSGILVICWRWCVCLCVLCCLYVCIVFTFVVGRLPLCWIVIGPISLAAGSLGLFFLSDNSNATNAHQTQTQQTTRKGKEGEKSQKQ